MNVQWALVKRASRLHGWLFGAFEESPPAVDARGDRDIAYCISEITSCDRLLLCLRAEVPACINSCLDVEFEVSAA